jgi:L-ascorbate metabolism protein UlaG (beta-lactamase superfamily)
MNRYFSCIGFYLVSALISGYADNHRFNIDKYGPWIDEAIKQGGQHKAAKSLAQKIGTDFFADRDPHDLVRWVEQGLKATNLHDFDKRKTLLTGLDLAVIIDQHNEFRHVLDHRVRTTRKVFEHIRNTKPQGLRLYKLYNEGVVLRNPSITVGIDIVLDPRNRYLKVEEVCDILFVSHEHSDHYDNWLVDEMKRLDKPVIFPNDDETISVNELLKDGKFKSLDWSAYKGVHVGTKFSNFFVLEIEEKKIVHSGDNTRWLKFCESEASKNIDVLLFKPEALFLDDETNLMAEKSGKERHRVALEETMKALNAKIVIPHHLLEIAGHNIHGYSHNVGFRARPYLPQGTDLLALHWGESFLIIE